MSRATYLTTHQVARLLGVSLPTVSKWVDQGLLKGHRTPGGHRRISMPDLRRFTRENDYPLQEDESEARRARGRRILIIDDEPDFADLVRDYLEIKGGFDIRVAQNTFDAGFALASFRPEIVLLDLEMNGLDGYALLALIRSHEDTEDTCVVACSEFSDQRIEQEVGDAAFDGLVHKPLSLDGLLEVLHEV